MSFCHIHPITSKILIFGGICALFLLGRGLSAAEGKAPFSFDVANHYLGSLDSYGYVRIVKRLTEIDVGADSTLPIYLVFSSDPRIEPGMFGPGWTAPLFSSVMIPTDRYEVLWVAPNGRRYYFRKSRSARSGSLDDEYYTDVGNNWRLQMKPGSDALVSSVDNPDWVFEYKDGRMTRFSLGKEYGSFGIKYRVGSCVTNIVREGDGKVLLEFEYQNRVNPSQMKTSEGVTHFEFGEGSLIAHDGKTDYGDLRLLFLMGVSTEAGVFEEFRYSHADGATGNRVRRDIDEGRSARALYRGPVNKIQYSKTGESISEKIKWEAMSGFIMSDSTATFSILNDSFDPFGNEGNEVSQQRSLKVPYSVKIEKFENGLEAKSWSYNWDTGVELVSSNGGKSFRRATYIKASGRTSGKIRSFEFLNENLESVRLIRNSYDANGDISRVYDSKKNRIVEYIERSRCSENPSEEIVTKLMMTDSGVRKFVYSGGILNEYWKGDLLVWKASL